MAREGFYSRKKALAEAGDAEAIAWIKGQIAKAKAYMIANPERHKAYRQRENKTRITKLVVKAAAGDTAAAERLVRRREQIRRCVNKGRAAARIATYPFPS